MMNYIWAAMIVVSFFCALATGRMPQLSEAVLEGAQTAVTLIFSMAGMMCLWTGLLKIADAGGITTAIAKLFSPIIRFLFPGAGKSSSKAICMNMTANLLGLGNAATPLGIAAMKELAKESRFPGTADNNMAMFVVINTASIQLIPTFMGTLRAQFGAQSPFDIVPAVWFASIGSLAIGIVVAKLLGRRKAHG